VCPYIPTLDVSKLLKFITVVFIFDSGVSAYILSPAFVIIIVGGAIMGFFGVQQVHQQHGIVDSDTSCCFV
jgi:hypothetical protein